MALHVSWPAWPQSTTVTEGLVIDALRSGRWAISETSNGERSFVQRAEHAFASMVGADFAVTTTSGTSAITLALESLGIERGAEVLVPGLTWIACASSVLNAGLRPVLVDVEPETMCMSVQAAEAATTEHTAAILLVHYMNNHAESDGFVALCVRKGLLLIEDCAQAHGAIEWGQHVGLRGHVGVFSFQASKTLTCGEGGALVTNDETVARRAEQYRADGRVFARGVPAAGASDLVPVGEVLGRNLCMSELTAAALLGAMRHFPTQHEERLVNAKRLDDALDGNPFITPSAEAAGTDSRSYYRYTVRFSDDVLAHLTIAQVMNRLWERIAVPVETLHEPLNANCMYRPDIQSTFKWGLPLAGGLSPARYDLPVANELFKSVITFPHHVLLAEQSALEQLFTTLTELVAGGSRV